MRISAIILLLGLVAIGVGLGAIQQSRLALLESGVVLEPPVVQFTEDTYEYQDIKILLQLRNTLDVPAEIQEITASCNCMDVVTTGNRPILSSFILNPGQSVPIQTTLHVTNTSGPQEFMVRFTGTVGERRIEGESKIYLNVRAGLRADPPVVYFRDVEPEKEHTAQLAILDSYPGDGIMLDRVESSDESVVSAQMDRVPFGEPMIERTEQKRRYYVVIKCTPLDTAGRQEYSLRFVPHDSKNAGLLIPVVVTTRRGPYSVTPPQLTVVGQSTGVIKRTLHVNLAEGASDKIVVLRAPDGVQVVIDNKRIHVQCDVSQIKLPIETEIIFGDSTTKQQLFSVPLTIRSDLLP